MSRSKPICRLTRNGPTTCTIHCPVTMVRMAGSMQQPMSSVSNYGPTSAAPGWRLPGLDLRAFCLVNFPPDAMGSWVRSASAIPWKGGHHDMLRATIVLMNRELELLIREVIMQTALRKQSWQQPGNPT